MKKPLNVLGVSLFAAGRGPALQASWLMLALVSLVAPSLWAHPPDEFDPASSRTWTDVRTGATHEGSFVASRSGRVAIATADGELATIALADLDAASRLEAEGRIAAIRAANESAVARASGAPAGTAGPAQAAIFAPFAPFVKTRFDDRWLYVESDGLPHEPLPFTMMVGIRTWQQQVPLPQPYVGANAWQIPLKPELAEKPVSARQFLRRGAIALAANGIPIFNALNNRGADAFAIGELDEFGGHCGRADDYHYHAAPLALQKVVGPGKPIAYGLDGFAIYGLFDPKAKPGSEMACPLGGTDPLDELNGHFCTVPKGEGLGGSDRTYHYHSSREYPYINGGMRGTVTVEDDQIVPQPRANPVRPSLTALRGARITGFRQVAEKSWSLEYEISGARHRVDYRIEADGKVAFTFTGPDGVSKQETYESRGGGGGGGGRPREGGRGGDRPPPREGGRGNDRPPPPARPAGGFTLECTSLESDGMLAERCTCDSKSGVVSPGFRWSGLPKDTKSLALTIHHLTPDGDERVYLVRAGLPADSASIAEGSREGGRFGMNSVNRRAEFAPPCSQGPGEKVYVATLYALSAEPSLPADAAALTRESLLAAIGTSTLGTATLDLRYARPEGDEATPPPPPQGGEGRGRRGGGGRQGGNAEAGAEGDRGTLLSRLTAFRTEVPATDHDLILCRPTRTSMTVSARASTARDGWIEFAKAGDAKTRSLDAQPMKPGETVLFDLTGLEPDAEYAYRFCWKSAGGQAGRGDENRFRTPASPGTAFTFAIQADSHLDSNMDTAVYARTLGNMAADRPAFLVDLGDTFMTDKRGRDFTQTLPQYDAQRHWFGIPCRAAPLFMALGNHDGEKGDSGTAAADIGPWSYAERTSRFPPPVTGAGGMYTGDTAFRDGQGSNYYAFEWGDALVIVLDPFWSTTQRIRSGGGGGARGGEGQGGGGGGNPDRVIEPTDASWAMTLGREQYDWLDRTLAASKAPHRFVFIHHLVGGKGGSEARGGAESSLFFEWGGRNADGSPGFAERRPGWPMPIHDLLVKHGVDAVFHRHDHLYVHSGRDGLTYQCVPQPGNPAGGTRSAEGYGYRSGTILGSPGYLRVKVTPEAAKVEFVRSAIEGGDARRREREANGTVVDSYELPAARTSTP